MGGLGGARKEKSTPMNRDASKCKEEIAELGNPDVVGMGVLIVGWAAMMKAS